jgi:hypothetical protein
VTATAQRTVATGRPLNLRRAHDRIDRAYDEPLDLDHLAAVAGVSKYHFVRKTHEELRGKGVTFLQEPAERPYGVEAVMRDNSGNWLVLVEPTP